MKTSIALCISLALNLFLASALIKSCNDGSDCPEIHDSVLVWKADTTTHIAIYDTIRSVPVKKISKKEAVEQITKTVIRDTAIYFKDSLCNMLADCLATVRHFQQEAGDSLVGIQVSGDYIGFQRSLKIAWTHKIPDIYSHNYLQPEKANYYIISSVMGGYQSGAGISLMRVKKVAYGIGISTLDGKGYFNVGFGVKINK